MAHTETPVSWTFIGSTRASLGARSSGQCRSLCSTGLCEGCHTSESPGPQDQDGAYGPRLTRRELLLRRYSPLCLYLERTKTRWSQAHHEAQAHYINIPDAVKFRCLLNCSICLQQPRENVSISLKYLMFCFSTKLIRTHVEMSEVKGEASPRTPNSSLSEKDNILI